MAPGPEPGATLELPECVRSALERAQQRGFIGPVDLERQIKHAAGFLGALEAGGRPPPPAGELVADLGSGGGLPGLVAAALRPEAAFGLIESSERRAALLREAVRRCDWETRVEVLPDRAEALGRAGRWRGRAAAVLARGFGGPAATAECASGLLRVGGTLVVSEPPSSDGSRWDPAGLDRLGMELVAICEVDGFGFAVVVQARPCPEAFPRRIGVPRKRPLF